MCGADKPHMHHIDEDPGNNDPLNLLPLCPNCHLTDQHNPTARLEQDRLRLFRLYKDPIILMPQFEPLLKRLRFLDTIRDHQDVAELEQSGVELCEFVASLNMGMFYSTQVRKLLERPKMYAVTWAGRRNPEHEAREMRHHQEYRQQLRKARSQVYDLAVELLRYQDSWQGPADRK